MSRLTEKSTIVIGGYQAKLSSNGMESQSAILSKLGQLEDIEEELGIDLITLFKCKIGKKVFVKRGNEIVEMVIDGMEYSFDHIVEIAGTFVKAHIVPKYKPNTIYTARVYSLYTKDYGKTWALTKEELLWKS